MEKHPEKTHGIVYRNSESIFSFNGWPSVTKDENGVLYAVCSGFRVAHICPFGKTVMYVSHNEGKTWSSPIVIGDTLLDDRDAGILYLGNGRLLVTWFCHSAEAYVGMWRDSILNRPTPMERAAVEGMLNGYEALSEEAARGGSYVRISENYGMTWSEPIGVPVSAPHGPALCSDGTLLYLGKEMYHPTQEIQAKGKICAYRSADGGYTWQHLSELAIPEGMTNSNFHEPYAIELPNGTLLGAIRVQGENVKLKQTIYTTTSLDGGKTWSPMQETGLVGLPPHFMIHSSGALICSFSRRIAPYSQRAAISYDMGKTWQDEYILDDRQQHHDFGYPTSVELSDGSILTVYYQRAEGDRKPSILQTIWKL